VPPWKKRVRLKAECAGSRSDKREENEALGRRKLANNAEFDWVLYTDGSALEGREMGGAAVVVTKEGPEGRERIEEKVVQAGRWCSSYQAEMVALVEALE
jgi:hypothetical protein